MHQAVHHPTSIAGIDVVSILSDRTFPRHSHDEFGIGVMQVRGQYSWSGRGTVEAGVGDVMTVNPSELHDGLGIAGAARGWQMMYFSPEAIGRLVDVPLFGSEIESPVVRCPKSSWAVRQAITAVTDPFADPSYSEERLMIAVETILRPRKIEKTHKHAPLSKPILRVLDRIESEPEVTLSLQDFAQISGMSRFQVLRRFSKEVGTSPHGFLTQLRVKLAKRAIADGQPLADAAVAVGFADQSHMTRAFSRQFGTTPGRYLNAHNARICNIVQS